MNTTDITLMIIAYFFSTLICAGFFLAKEYHNKTNYSNFDRESIGIMIIISLTIGLFGPIGWVMAYLMTGFGQYGWRLVPKNS